MKKVISILLVWILVLGSMLFPMSNSEAISKKNKSKQSAAVVASGASISTASAVSSSAVTSSAVKKKNNYKYKNDKRYTKCSVNLRKKPNKKSKIKKVLKLGTKVKRIYIRKDGWAKVKYKKKKGFVKNKFLVKKKPQIIKSSDTKLTGIRKANADRIAKVCIDNYSTYGIFPSVCVAQAFCETGIGTAYNNGNLWGLCTNNYAGYSSMEAGCIAYLKCVNHEWYKGASFATDYKTQLYHILYGGYCLNPVDYMPKVLWAIKEYNLTDYDKYI